MAFEKISANLERLNKNVKALGESSAEYYKLDMFAKVMKGATTTVSMVVIGFLSLFFLLFISLAASVWLSNVIDIPSSGFFIVAGFYFLLILFMLLFGRKMIRKKMLIKISRKVFNKPDKEGKKEI